MSTIYLPRMTGFTMQQVRIPRRNLEERDRLIADNRCVRCGEPIEVGEQVTRGMHRDTCYQNTWYQVNVAQTTTWVDEIRAGRALPPGNAGRKPRRRAREVLAG